MTVWRESIDWWEDLLGDRDPGLSTGELEGVIFRDAPGPASLLFALRGAVVAIASVGCNVSPLSGVFACHSADAFVVAQRKKKTSGGEHKRRCGGDENQ